MNRIIASVLLAGTLLTGAAFAADPAAQAELNRQLREAATVDDVDTVRKLLADGADVNGANEFGKNALMRAVESGASKSAYVLLSKGANVNARTTAGYTALTYAAENGHADISAMLVELGANVHDRTRAGWDAMMIAARLGYDVIVAQLRSSSASLGAKIPRSRRGRITRRGRALMSAAVRVATDELPRALAAQTLAELLRKTRRTCSSDRPPPPPGPAPPGASLPIR